MAERPHPTARDVARLAGVSQSVVSRAFTPGAGIAAATRDKVIRTAESLGYRPNLLARSLNKGQTGIVGVVIGMPRYAYFFTALEILSARLSKAGKHMLVYAAGEETTVDTLVGNLLEFRADALILMAVTLSPEIADQCSGRGVPIVSFRAGRDMGLNSVSGDNLGGGARMAEHLLMQGYRQIALISGLSDAPSGREREIGFVGYLVSQGLPPPPRASGHAHMRPESGDQATRDLLSRADRPDAIFCINDYMAIAAIEVARYEFGLEIGRELGVAGFEDVEQASWRSFNLTSYTLPVENMVDRVLGILENSGRTGAPTHEVVLGELKARDSTRRI